MKERDPFCDRKTISGNLVYETRFFYLLYDIKPVLPGHVMAIPKRHVRDITDLNEKEMVDLWRLMRKAVPVLSRIYRSGGSYNLVAQSGPYSGRSIGHLHIHIVPRHRNDKFRMKDDRLYVELEKRRKLLASKAVIAKEVARLRKALKYSP